METPKSKRFFLFTLICCAASMLWLGCSVSYERRSAKKPLSALELAMKNVRRYDIYGGGSCSMTIVSPTQAFTAAHCMPAPEALIISPTEMINVFPPMWTADAGKISLKPLFVSHDVDGAVIGGKFTEDSYPEVDTNGGEVYAVEEAWLCGYPMFSNELRCTKAKRVENSRFAAHFQASVIPGQSGGAVFSLEGKLIGIIQYMTQEGLAGVGSVSGLQSGVGRK